MSSIRCKVGWHDWSKFGAIIKSYMGLTQFKYCERCNIITYSHCHAQANPEDINKTTEQQIN